MSRYFIVPLFDHPGISTSRTCRLGYYVVLFHVVPLFDRPVDLSHYLPSCHSSHPRHPVIM